jgi:ribosomal protein S27E
VAYLHCPSCDRSAWLDTAARPALRCHHCDTPLAPMSAGRARRLTDLVRRRFARDAVLDAGRARFVRD